MTTRSTKNGWDALVRIAEWVLFTAAILFVIFLLLVFMTMNEFFSIFIEIIEKHTEATTIIQYVTLLA